MACRCTALHLQGWVSALLVFWLVVILVTPPPAFEHEQAARRRRPTGEIRPAKRTDDAPSVDVERAGRHPDGDALVICDLDTPFADDGASGLLHIAVHRQQAPLASGAFLDMVGRKHFDRNFVFRSVDNFIVQWGIESPGLKTKGKFAKVGIDPPGSPPRANSRGSLNFAGGRSASGQVYVNRVNNNHLDREPGARPFATLDEKSMSIIDSIHSYKEGMGQVKAVNKGENEVRSQFPMMSRIVKCWIEDDG